MRCIMTANQSLWMFFWFGYGLSLGEHV
uniref:Uncharacterized protein n=1 Tax=Anguilla anguilla TaxID=7936 RepID=A0A0E9PPY3_ANGAN